MRSERKWRTWNSTPWPAKYKHIFFYTNSYSLPISCVCVHRSKQTTKWILKFWFIPNFCICIFPKPRTMLQHSAPCLHSLGKRVVSLSVIHQYWVECYSQRLQRRNAVFYKHDHPPPSPVSQLVAAWASLTISPLQVLRFSSPLYRFRFIASSSRCVISFLHFTKQQGVTEPGLCQMNFIKKTLEKVHRWTYSMGESQASMTATAVSQRTGLTRLRRRQLALDPAKDVPQIRSWLLTRKRLSAIEKHI